MSLFDKVKDAARSVMSYADMKTTNKDKLVKLVSIAIDELEIVESTLKSLPDLDRKKLKNDFINKAAKYPSPFLKTFFKNFHHDLHKAESIEARLAFGSIQKSVENLKKTLTESLKGDLIDTLFEDEVITIKDVTISQATFFMTVSAARLVAKYSTYLLGVAMSFAYLKTDPELDDIPVYKLKFMQENYQEFVTVVSKTAIQTGQFNFMQDIKAIKKSSAHDFSLNIFGSVNSGVASSSFSYVKGFSVLELLGFGLHVALIPFSMIGDVWIQYKHNTNTKNVYLKEWFEQRVALLKLEYNTLSNTESDREKKAKLENTIANYEDLIAKFEQKIADYEGK